MSSSPVPRKVAQTLRVLLGEPGDDDQVLTALAAAPAMKGLDPERAAVAVELLASLLGIRRPHFRTARLDEDSPGSDQKALSRVFQVGSVPGAYNTTHTVYTETAARFDSRASRGPLAPGFLTEIYGGRGAGVANETARFVRVGARAAAFLPLMRRSTILLPSLVLDGVAQIGQTPVPFTELTDQPDFRGPNTRKDRVSAVASLDYRWAFLPFLAARIFADLATVAPRLEELTVDHVRFAGGGGLEAFSPNEELARFAVSGGVEGIRVLLSIGVSSGFGDRQHRD